jgi:hypothetical protein
MEPTKPPTPTPGAPAPTPTPAPTPQGKAFTNATVPKPPMEEVILRDDQIVAKPLRTPDFINMKPKNKNLCFFWGNRSVGDKESKMRFNQLQAMGFTPAVPNDVEGVCPDSLVFDGKIFFGDLVLMKIPRADYIGAQKWNAQTAMNRVRKPGMTADVTGDDQLAMSSVSEITRNPKLAGKVSFFTPSPEQAAALTGATGSKDK